MYIFINTYIYICTYMYIYICIYIYLRVCVSLPFFGRCTGWRRRRGCIIFTGHFTQKSPMTSGSYAERDLQLTILCVDYRVAKTQRMPSLSRSFSAKEPCNWWLFCGKRPTTSGILSIRCVRRCVVAVVCARDEKFSIKIIGLFCKRAL